MESASLSVEGVWKRYSRGTQWTEVLQNVSLGVPPGEVVAVTGSRFDGKTTLLKIAAGMERPDRGAVWLGDLEVTGFGEGERTRLLGREVVWIDRDGPGLNVEVSKFVGFPVALHGHGRRRAKQEAGHALERVGARRCMGRRWGELSNWQRVLVGLARAFVGSPQVVIIDDLLDALGGRATEEASGLLRSLMEACESRCGVLMSVSDVESALYADRVWSITAKRRLKLMAGRQTDGKVIPLPDRDGTRSGGSFGIGCS